MIDLNRQAELRRAIEQFYFAYRAFTAGPDKVLEQRGLGRVHHRILYFVAHYPAVTINQLLKILGVSKQALNAPMRQLIEMKLVTVCAAPHDGRVKQLTLSETGKRLEEQLTQIQLKQLAEAFQLAGANTEFAWSRVMEVLAETNKELK